MLVHSGNCDVLERIVHTGYTSCEAYDEARRKKGNEEERRKKGEAIRGAASKLAETMAAAGATTMPSGGEERGELTFSKDEAKALFSLKEKDLAEIGVKNGVRWQYKFQP